MASQPATNNDRGVVLTVGGFCGTDPVAMTFPMFTDDATLTDSNICNDAQQSFINLILPSVLLCMATDAEVRFVSAEGMVDGKLPQRQDFAPGAQPGARTAPSMPSSVCGLLTYYEDPVDVLAGHRIGTGHNFFWGMSKADITNDIISGTLASLYSAVGSLMVAGVATVAGVGKWYRGLAAPKPRTAGQHIKRITGGVVRLYCGTQRRRLIPH